MASVDVAIPCYQYGRFLRECVASVLNQDVDVRVLIIDNASTDDTLEVAMRLAVEDSRVAVQAHRTNLGPHAAYNAGIAWASADYFLVLDADDLLAPGCLSRAVAIMESDRGISFTHGAEIRFHGGEPHHEDRSPVGNWQVSSGAEFIETICHTPVNHVGAPTVVRRTATQKRIGGYRPELPYSDDLEMWLRLATVGRVASTTSVQAYRRVHPSQMSEQFRVANQVRDFREREAAFASFFAHEGRTIPQAARLLETAKQGLGEHAYWSAISHICRGHWRSGAQLFDYSRTRRPRRGYLPPLGWLLRMERPLNRIGAIGMEALGWKRQTGHP